MATLSEPLALSVDYLAKATGLHRSTVYQAVARGDIPARRFGKRVLILAPDAAAWLAALPFVAQG